MKKIGMKMIDGKLNGKLLAGMLLTIGLLARCGAARVQDNPADRPAARPSTIQFLNGQWFNGKSFAPATFYSVNGLLTRHRPAVVDTVMDLHNGYVVPPFGDAHCHHFDSAYNVEQQIEMYLRDGVFYAKVLTNSLAGARAVAGRVNIPTSVDVFYAHGGLTGNNSHPIPTYEGTGLGYYNGKDMEAHKDEILKSRRRENDCYYIVDTSDDLEKKWPLILQGKPDFIKVYLLHSEDYEARKAKQGYGGGIDPKLLPQIVSRAHVAGLTVSAHVDSASDYRCALKAGVDEMAHLPGYYVGIHENILNYALSPQDAKETARRGVHVTPTANLTDYLEKADEKQKTQTNQIRNLKLLKDAGVQFGIGTDSYGTDALKEALYLSKLGVWNNLEMLKIWCETTPRAIFRQRKIGFLREGYEASFVVLDADPLTSFDNVTKIALRCKQGNMLQTSPPPTQSSVQTPAQYSSQSSSPLAAQSLLKAAADTMAATKTLTASYEVRRRFLDPYEEIREEGTIRLARPNLAAREGWTLLLSKTSGKWERAGKAAGVVSNGQNAYALTSLPNGLQYRQTKADADGKNVLFDVLPLIDFFDSANSFDRQAAQAQADNTLQNMHIVGTEECEGVACQVVEFDVATMKNKAPYRCHTRLAIGADKRVRHLVSSVKMGDLATEQEFFLRDIHAGDPLGAEVFAYQLPANAVPYTLAPALLTRGVPAPDFTIRDRDGKTIRLSDYKGKTVVLDFWATWCVPCLKSFPHTLDALRKFKAQGVTVIAVNVLDATENMARYAAAHPEYAEFVFASDAPDAPARMMNLYRVSNIPLLVIITPDGKIAASIEGYTGSSSELEAVLQSVAGRAAQ